jgi:hypothetical protein
MKKIYRNITWPIRGFFRKCRNVLRWLPTIWKDEDWDNSFIVDILIKKLEHQRNFFLSDRTHILDAKKVAAEIQIAIDGLRKTADPFDHYEAPAVAELDRKWGEGVFRFEPWGENEGLRELHIDYPNVKTAEDKEQHDREYREAMQMARKLYVKDKRAAYKYIADNIDMWWD